jgi:hypothetical protein
MRLATFALCFSALTQALASAAPAPSSDFVAGISPFLDSAAKDTVYRGLVRLIVEDLPLNSTLEVYDAFDLKSITKVSIPGAAVFNSPKTRANQFASSIGDIRRFLAQNNAPKPGFDRAVRLPQFCDFLAQNKPSSAGNLKLPILLIGSPLYQDTEEPNFSMADGYFPSDGHLRATRDQSLFGLNPGDNSSQAPLVYWAYFGDPWISELYREKVERFWALYLERRGGRLASFSGDLATAFGAFDSQSPGRSAASNGWIADSRQTVPEMLRVSRNVEQTDWLLGDAKTSSSPPLRLVGPLKIGIRWKEDIDLDLYAAPRRGAETLFFQHPKSPEGYYSKDHRSSPGHEYEYIEFESPVDVRKALAYVNFYNGSCPGGPRGEVRVEFFNRIYTGAFAIHSPEGNQGRSGPLQTNYWSAIPIQQILGIKSL